MDDPYSVPLPGGEEERLELPLRLGEGRVEGPGARPRDPWFRARVLLVAGWLGFLWLAYGVLDLTIPWVSATTPVLFLFLALGGLLTLPLLIGRGRGLRHLMAAVALFGAFAAGIAHRYHSNDDLVKPFARAFAGIRSGMTPAEVDAVFRAQFPGRLPLKEGGGGSISYILDPDDGRYNSEIIYVKLTNGRVVAVEYLPD